MKRMEGARFDTSKLTRTGEIEYKIGVGFLVDIGYTCRSYCWLPDSLEEMVMRLGKNDKIDRTQVLREANILTTTYGDKGTHK